MFCPSCYVDCGKHAQSDADGRAMFENLDPELLFNLMTVADGYSPLESGMVDPDESVVRLQLEAKPPLPDEPGHVVRARVVDAAGNPVQHAVVTPMMFYFPPSENSRAYGTSDVPGADPLGITDAEGFFEIVSPTKINRVAAVVRARALCSQVLNNLGADDPTQIIVLKEGATVSGQLVDGAGRPVVGRTVGLSQADRSMEAYVGDYSIDTDENGKFLFVNVPAGQEVYVFGKWKSLSEVGSVQPVRFKTPGDGQQTEEVKLSLSTGHTFRGRVVLSDGQPIPEGKGVMLVSSHSIWDACPEFILPSDGSFELRNLPTDSYDIGVHIQGYHLSNQNPSFDSLNRMSITGRIERNIDRFIVLMEPGPMDWSMQQPREKPLQSYTGPVPASGESN